MAMWTGQARESNSGGSKQVPHVTSTSPRRTRSFGGFLKAIVRGDLDLLERRYGTVIKTALGENSGSIGGFLVPPDYTTKLLTVIAEDSFLYPRVNLIPMRSGEMLAPQIDNDTVPVATGQSPFFGGITFSWGSEQAPTETEPKFQSMSLRAWDLLGYANVSNDFLGDIGEEGEDYLIRAFGRAAAWYAEYAFLQGCGAAQKMPLGVLNAPATIYVNRAAGGAIGAADVANMSAALLPFSWKRSIWAASPSTLGQIDKISNFFLNSGEPTDTGYAGMLVGRPLYVTEKVPPLGTPGDLVLIDPSLYVVANRMEVLIDASPHAAFSTNQTVFRIWLRLDGKPQVASKITLQDKVTQVSPYVALN